MSEPALREADRAAWSSWMDTVAVHAQTSAYRRRVDAARRVIGDSLDVSVDMNLAAAVMWSAGKDSTALTHLVCVDAGLRVPVYSEKDDLDYPGEEEYVTDLAVQWGLDLRIIRPPVSPAGWMAEHGHKLQGSDDLHSRAAGLSKECFYGVVESATANTGMIYLGLRAGESHGRAMNLYSRGPLYQKKNGKWTCCPLAHWRGIDVYTYLMEHDIPLLPVYRCIAFMHADEPWRVRKSWWVPGSAARHGGTAWLRHYYPSLYQRLCDWIPTSRLLA